MTSMRRLVEILRNKGALRAEWAGAVAAVDRALFVPDRCPALDRAADEAAWLRTVYGDLPVVTQVDDGADGGPGAPTSSSSQPSMMLRMLDLLAVREGHRVLEIGTGTGYHAAWLCHRLGAERVVSVEVDEALHRRARRSLERAGFAPRLVLGDGLAGWPAGAPYERVVSTCTLREIPPALLAQVAEGGRLVTPFGTSFHSYSFLTLDVAGGTGVGRFSGRPAFMWARGHRGRGAEIWEVYRRQEGDRGSTDVDPRRLDHPDFVFFASLRVPDAWPVLHPADDGSGEATYWLLADDRASWATAEYVPGRDAYETDQYGPRRLWDEVEAAYREWVRLGEPERSRFGLTLRADTAVTWLDTPDHAVRRQTWQGQGPGPGGAAGPPPGAQPHPPPHRGVERARERPARWEEERRTGEGDRTGEGEETRAVAGCELCTGKGWFWAYRDGGRTRVRCPSCRPAGQTARGRGPAATA